jgi:hypothetical protein
MLRAKLPRSRRSERRRRGGELRSSPPRRRPRVPAPHNIGGEFMSPRTRSAVAHRAQATAGANEAASAALPDETRSRTSRSRGHADRAERQIINHHIEVTIQMLEALPWPKHLKNVPEYAGGHHERMDGKGYPRGLTASRCRCRRACMGIADIFEALTAKDRPYKKGKTLTESLTILGKFKLNGHVDPTCSTYSCGRRSTKYAERVPRPRADRRGRRKGSVRSFHVPSVNVKNLKPILESQINAAKTRLMTDGERPLRALAPMVASHETVNHEAGEYVRGDVHTNTVEGYFSILKRGIIGTFHHVSEQHLQRYTTEFDFRYNHRETRVKVDGKWEKRGFNDTERTIAALKGIGGKRLTYRRINGAA